MKYQQEFMVPNLDLCEKITYWIRHHEVTAECRIVSKGKAYPESESDPKFKFIVESDKQKDLTFIAGMVNATFRIFSTYQLTPFVGL